MMQLDIRVQGLELTDELAEHIDRHFRFALTRFGSRVRRVHVLVRDLNGPRGGRDIECKVRVRLTTRETVVLTDLQDDAFTAVASASDRIAFAVSKRIERMQERWRSRARQGFEFVPASEV